MNKDTYTVEEVAQQLKVSKLTVYDLIKKGALAAYRVGRQMRIDANDLETYKSKGKGEQCYPNPDLLEPKAIDSPSVNSSVLADIDSMTKQEKGQRSQPIIISGQDISLDILSNHIERHTKAFRPLRSYVGSLDSLISMYLGEADIVSTHLLDADTNEYNIPYVRRLLVSESLIITNLIIRRAGFYVQKGNPKNINTWDDLKRSDIKMINREKGSGARVLIDEQLRVHSIPKHTLQGYLHEETNHLGVAGAIANGTADVGIGIEKAARLVDGIEFIPLVNERYDLVVLNNPSTKPLVELLLSILQSDAFKKELEAIGGYDLSQTGKIIYQS